MLSVISVNPFRCRMWALHDRLEPHVTAESCKAEIESFSRHGQLVPALGRPLQGEPLYDVELIFGARRLFVAQHLNQPLSVELREMSDRDAIIAMDIENRHRADISAYERGLGYARWIRSGHFSSQDEIARALRISSSQVSRSLKLSRLPAVILAAFESPTDLREGWGLELVEALDDPARRQTTIRAARAVVNEPTRPSSREVYRRLMAASARGRKTRRGSHDQVVKDNKGKPIFRIRLGGKSVTIVLPAGKVSARNLDLIVQNVRNILESETDQRGDPPNADAAAIQGEHTLLASPPDVDGIQDALATLKASRSRAAAIGSALVDLL
jgi:ParB family chromosome partitioning protein